MFDAWPISFLGGAFDGAFGEAPLLLGANGAGVSNSSYGANNTIGIGFLASGGGTLRSLNILASDAAGAALGTDWQLGIYAATDANSWGTLLAFTPRQTGISTGETRSLPLNTPVTIVAGQYYALVVITNGTLPLRNAAGSSGRFFADTFSDGFAATAGTTSNNGPYPVLWGTNDIVDLTSSAFSVGPYGDTGVGNSNYGANFAYGRAFVANRSGTVNKIGIRGSSAASSSVNYRLGIYAATDFSTWGALLGQSNVQTSLGIDEVKEVDLQSSVSITAGNYYAIVLQANGTMAARNFASSNGRFVSDTYSDGLRDPQNATSNNGPSPVLWVRAV